MAGGPNESGHEAIVHHVEVNPIGAGLFDGTDFFAKTTEVEASIEGAMIRVMRPLAFCIVIVTRQGALGAR